MVDKAVEVIYKMKSDDGQWAVNNNSKCPGFNTDWCWGCYVRFCLCEEMEKAIEERRMREEQQ